VKTTPTPQNGPFSALVRPRASIRRALLAAALLALLVGGCSKGEEPERPTAAPHRGRAQQQIVTGTGVEMVLIASGRFLMGDDRGEDDERPTQTVHVGAFYMDKYEVTQQAYQGLMGRNPSKFKAPDKPVEQVSWYAAVKYCNMRSLREGLDPCYDPETLKCDFEANGYRLPTEAEWEYACRAGTRTRYSFGNDPGKLGAYAWSKGNANGETHPVGQKAANPWGLYDMHGNVAEWCNDFYGEAYYGQSERDDPRGPASGEDRVLRGGCWSATGDSCRSSARNGDAPGFADVCFGYDAYGFRCVKKVPEDAPE